NDSSEVGVHRQRVLALSVELTPSVRMRRNQLHVNATTATKPTRLGEMSFLFARTIQPTTKLITSGSPEKKRAQALIVRWENIPTTTDPATMRRNPRHFSASRTPRLNHHQQRNSSVNKLTDAIWKKKA